MGGGRGHGGWPGVVPSCCGWLLCVVGFFVLSLCCVDCRVDYPMLVECFPPQHLVGCDHPRMPSTCEYSSQ
jgi:hypothetical protein